MITKDFLNQCIAKYDANKSYLKQWGLRSDALNIQNLAEFINKLPSDINLLNPEQLLELAHIILVKDLSISSASTSVFKEIVNKLGGEEHLKALQQSNKLTQASAALLSECKPEQQRSLTLLIIDIDSIQLIARYESCLALSTPDSLISVLAASLNFTPDELKLIQICCQNHSQSDIKIIFNAFNHINEKLIYAYATLDDTSEQNEFRSLSLEQYIQAFKLLNKALSVSGLSGSDAVVARYWDDGESLLNGSAEENEFYLSDLINKLTQITHSHISSFTESLELLDESGTALLNPKNILGLWQFIDTSTLNFKLIRNSPLTQKFLDKELWGEYYTDPESSELYEQIETSEPTTQQNPSLSQVNPDHISSIHILAKSLSAPCESISKKRAAIKTDALAQHPEELTLPKSPRPKAFFVLFNEVPQSEGIKTEPQKNDSENEFISVPI